MMKKHKVEIDVKTQYIDAQSSPENNRYVFAYHITITNQGRITTQLISRHWIITDENEKVEEVKGAGVVGEQPVLESGKSFSYTSGAVLETPVGHMRGSYQMQSEDGKLFDAEIEPFVLSMPRTLH